MAPSPEKYNGMGWVNAQAVRGSVSLLETAQRYGLRLTRKGREWAALSPFKAERTPSFFVDDRKGLFKCFASGEGGDVIRFVQLMDGCDFREALERLTREHGLGDPAEQQRRAQIYAAQSKVRQRHEAEAAGRKIKLAGNIWCNALPAEGTLVERYLASRGIDLVALRAVYGCSVPNALRYCPDAKYREGPIIGSGPAMIGVALRHIRGRPQFSGIHRTWLAPDGSGKAAIECPKKTLGSMFGAMTLLSPVCEEAVLGEGYETTLSVMAALARAGRSVCGISGLFLGNIAGAGIRQPDAVRGEISIEPDMTRPGLMLPDGIKRVIILKDADGKRPEDIDKFLRRAATKFQLAGVKVRIASPTQGDDFSDMALREVA